MCVALIPARLASTRLPNKVLADIHGHPLIWHVWNRVSRARQLQAVYITTDSQEVQHVVEDWGGRVLMTSSECRSGTERIVECLPHLDDAELIINVQGDEPLVDPAMLDSLVEHWEASRSDVITPVYRITDPADLANPNVVKVVRSRSGDALYFSRSSVPYVRDVPHEQWLEVTEFWGHVGVYGYRSDVLRDYPNLPVSRLEEAEKLEQLRFLDAGYRIQTFETDYRPVAVDVAEDLERVRELLKDGNVTNG